MVAASLSFRFWNLYLARVLAAGKARSWHYGLTVSFCEVEKLRSLTLIM